MIGKARRIGLGFDGSRRTNGVTETHGKVVSFGGPKAKPRPKLPAQAKPLSRFMRSMKFANEPQLKITANIDPSLHVKLLDLEPHHCRWPVVDDLYCGAHKLTRHLAYCSIHALVARRKDL